MAGRSLRRRLDRVGAAVAAVAPASPPLDLAVLAPPERAELAALAARCWRDPDGAAFADRWDLSALSPAERYRMDDLLRKADAPPRASPRSPLPATGVEIR